MRRKAIALVVLAATVVLVGSLGSRERHTWNSVVTTVKGERLGVVYEFSRMRGIGLHEVFYIGGGGERWGAKVSIGGQNWNWSVDSNCRPFIIERKSTVLYVACLDATDPEHPRYRTFSQEGGGPVLEFNGRQFPRNLAVQNVFDHTNQIVKLEPERPEFRDSLTVRFWSFLVSGRSYHDPHLPDETFAREYIDRNLTRGPNASSAVTSP